MSIPEIGQPAPDFTLSSQYGEQLRLSELHAQSKVLLVFYPFAFSSVCGGEFDRLSELNDRFLAAGIAVVGVSVDSKFALQAWSESKGIPFALVADFWPHGAVARDYGVFDEKSGMALRGTFLIGTDGVIESTLVNPARDARDFTRFLPS